MRLRPWVRQARIWTKYFCFNYQKKTYFKISYLGLKIRFNFLVKVILPRDNQIIDLATADWESIVTSQVVPIYNSVPFRNLVKILIWKNKLLIKFLTFQSLIVLSFVESKKCAALRRGSQRILLIWKNKVWQWNKMVEKKPFLRFRVISSNQIQPRAIETYCIHCTHLNVCSQCSIKGTCFSVER